MDSEAIRNFLDGRKSVHVKLMPGTRSELRKVLFQKGLSMQEVFEDVAKRIAMNDPTIELIVDALVESKGAAFTERTGGMNVDMVFDAIDNASPLDDEGYI